MRKAIAGVAAICLLMVPMLAGQRAKAKSRASAAAIARGRYLVESVGMCGDCHSPRNEKGEFIREQLLAGAPLSFKPIDPMPVWAEKAPAIAGLPGWDKDAAIRFFMTGIVYNGLPPRPPMPAYRFRQADAEAVVAYLKSLAPAK